MLYTPAMLIMRIYFTIRITVFGLFSLSGFCIPGPAVVSSVLLSVAWWTGLLVFISRLIHLVSLFFSEDKSFSAGSGMGTLSELMIQ